MTNVTDLLLYMREVGVADIESLKSVFPNVNVLLTRLVNSGRIARLKRGHYTSIPFDPFKVAKFVSSGYVSFYSALYYYNAVDEVPATITIATRGISRKRVVFDTEFQEVSIGRRFRGYVDGEVRVATRAKAVFDSFKRPDLGGGFSRLLKALFEMKLKKNEWKEFIDYFNRFERPSSFQKMGYLLSLSNPPKWVIQTFERKAGASKVFLWGRSPGKLIKNWNVIDNIGRGVLLSWMKG